MYTDLHACCRGRKEVVLDMVVFTSLRAHYVFHHGNFLFNKPLGAHKATVGLPQPRLTGVRCCLKRWQHVVASLAATEASGCSNDKHAASH